MILLHSLSQSLSGFSIQWEQKLIRLCVNSVVPSNVFGWFFLWPQIIFLIVYTDQYLMEDLMGECCRCSELFLYTALSSLMPCPETSHFDFLELSAQIRELLFQRETTGLHLASQCPAPLVWKISPDYELSQF